MNSDLTSKVLQELRYNIYLVTSLKLYEICNYMVET